MNYKKTDFFRSDLACEGGLVPFCGSESSRTRQVCGVRISEHFSAEGGRVTHFSTLETGEIRFLPDEEYESCVAALSSELSLFIRRAANGPIDGRLRIMVAGLGNRHITADSLGPLTVEKLTVTRHLPKSHGKILSPLGELCAIEPGVLGQTGIESGDIIKGAAAKVRPHAVIAVDSLAAKSTARLAATVQISDGGIRPGSGIGNRRMPITEETLGFPVIAVGVPTVVDSTTLVWDALENAGADLTDPAVISALEGERGFFVSPKETDLIVDEVSSLLASSIHRTVGL